MDAIVEPTSLFDQSLGDVGNIRNPRNSRDQVIIDVALTGVDGQSRTSDEAVERPLQVRYDQKIAKYGQVAKQNGSVHGGGSVTFHGSRCALSSAA